jgi:hypothetical protein
MVGATAGCDGSGQLHCRWCWRPVGVFLALRVGGGWAAAAVASALGLAAIAFQPRAWLGVGSDARTRRGRARVVAPAGIARQAVSTPDRGKASWLLAAARFMRLVHRPTIILDLFMFPLTVLCILMFHFPGLVLMIVTMSVPAYVIAVAFAGEVNNSSGRARSASQRWVQVSCIRCWSRSAPALMLPCPARLMNRGGLPGRLFEHSFFRAGPKGSAETLGARSLPERWPWVACPQIREPRAALLWLDLLRMTLFAVAALFVRTRRSALEREGAGFPDRFRVVHADRGLCAAPQHRRGRSNSLPPWWFGAILAAVAIVRWSRKVHM